MRMAVERNIVDLRTNTLFFEAFHRFLAGELVRGKIDLYNEKVIGSIGIMLIR